MPYTGASPSPAVQQHAGGNAAPSYEAASRHASVPPVQQSMDRKFSLQSFQPLNRSSTDWVVESGVSSELVSEFIWHQLIDHPQAFLAAHVAVRGSHVERYTDSNGKTHKKTVEDFTFQIPLQQYLSHPVVVGVDEAAEKFAVGAISKEDRKHTIDYVDMQLITQFAEMPALAKNVELMIRSEWGYRHNIEILPPPVAKRALLADQPAARCMHTVNNNKWVKCLCWMTCAKPFFDCWTKDVSTVSVVTATYTVNASAAEVMSRMRQFQPRSLEELR